MTKAGLIEQMAKISKSAAGKALNSLVDALTNALKKKDGKVTLVSFGTFSKVRRKATGGTNPATADSVKIKARKCHVFRSPFPFRLSRTPSVVSPTRS